MKFNVKSTIKFILTVWILVILCHILDIGWAFYDHRFIIGVIIGAVGYEPISKLVGKIKKLQ